MSRYISYFNTCKHSLDPQVQSGVYAGGDVGKGVPEPAAADTVTACHPSDLEPGSEEQIPGPSDLGSYSPATPELAQAPSETIPSADSTSEEEEKEEKDLSECSLMS